MTASDSQDPASAKSIDGHSSAARSRSAHFPTSRPRIGVSVLTGGGVRPYALGLAQALVNEEVEFDFIGSDDVGGGDDLPPSNLVRFLNLRGNQNPDATVARKMWRLSMYYFRLLRYALCTEHKIFHIVWNNRLEHFDRTLLMLYYRLLGKRVIVTVHNVNRGKRDGDDSSLNRWTLATQYRLANHLFVHTERMKVELQVDFAVPDARITLIPFGINSTVPDTALTVDTARQKLGILPGEKTLLFFGRIAPYKGLDLVVEALHVLAQSGQNCRLIIAGSPKGDKDHWAKIQQRISETGMDSQILQRIEFIPDIDTEVYFKAADVLVLPYRHIFQSGVLFLGYNFGLPVIATDVGSFREDIVEGETGILATECTPDALAAAISRYFSSNMYLNLAVSRQRIRAYARERHSWEKVGEITRALYSRLCPPTAVDSPTNRKASCDNA